MENKGKGKRSGARVIYVDVDIKETVVKIELNLTGLDYNKKE